MPGACVSSTATVNEHMALLPVESVATQFTKFVLTGNVAPFVTVQITARFVPQSSTAVTVNVRLLSEHWLASALKTRFVGHSIVGGAACRTVTVNEQLPPLAVVQFTTFVPTGNNEPAGG